MKQHTYNPTFRHVDCATCREPRSHPVHGPRLPPLRCSCGEDVERDNLREHLMKRHKIMTRGLDPWRIREKSLHDLIAIAEGLKGGQ